MSIELNDPARVVAGVGPQKAAELQRMGIETVSDLLTWFPRRYIDGSVPTPIADLQAGIVAAVQARVLKVKDGFTRKRGFKVVEAVLEDDSGEIAAQWFNQPYIKSKLHVGAQYVFIGVPRINSQGKLTFSSPRIEVRPLVVPLYPQTSGMKTSALNQIIHMALERVEVPDVVYPPNFPVGILPFGRLFTAVHSPTNTEEIGQVAYSLSYLEVFEYFSEIERQQQRLGKQAGIPIVREKTFEEHILTGLPFELTQDQRGALEDVLQDISSGSAMTRLLNGDVGSGKTVVAGVAAAVVARSGYKTVLLAPTAILAEQHAASLSKTLAHSGITIARWTASHKDAHAESADLIVGTHALLNQSLELEKLGLIVVDEQHRFGVEQRNALRSGKHGQAVHLLSMTATPIPRTLALTLFGDLSVSSIKVKPKGRLPIRTFVVESDAWRQRMYQKLTEEVAAGHQAFIICPTITEATDDSEETELQLFPSDTSGQAKKAVEAEYLRLHSVLPGLKIAMVHGKLKTKEKEEVMAAFQRGEYDVLVATTVIEVGVDVPNATVLVVEGAEQFGLAQLHQMRGRVGRGSSESYCFLCPHMQGGVIRERLNALVNSNDGFEIADADLELRGPGDMRGIAQSGLPIFRFASLHDYSFLTQVRQDVKKALAEHPEFKLPISLLPHSENQVSLE